MKIQQILNTPNVAKSTQNKAATNSLNANQTQNNFLNGISFKGYSQVWQKGGHAGTSGSLRVEKYDINVNSCYQRVSEGKAGHIKQDVTYASCNIYYADPGEVITDKIRSENRFIVEYIKRPREITMQEVEEASTTSELRDLSNDLKTIVVIDEADVCAAERNLDEANEALRTAEDAYERARAELASARSHQEKCTMDRDDKEARLEADKKKQILADAKYEDALETERREYRAAERKRKLAALETQISTTNTDFADQIKKLQQQQEARLAELEKQKQALLDEE